MELGFVMGRLYRVGSVMGGAITLLFIPYSTLAQNTPDSRMVQRVENATFVLGELPLTATIAFHRRLSSVPKGLPLFPMWFKQALFLGVAGVLGFF